jgi:N-acetylglucosaminyldiphosphoundecaprenol N-acetyl-beta-D-mannosaminyltransferase
MTDAPPRWEATGIAAEGTAPPTVVLAGMRLARLDRRQVADRIFGALARGQGGWVVTANVDLLRTYVRDPEIRELWSTADLIVADGIPLLWAAALQGDPLPDRVAGSDLVWTLAERAAAEGRTLFLLGGAIGVAEEARKTLLQRWPRLQIAGASSPTVSAMPTADELAPVRDALRAARPDIVYAALGSPKQERVIAALRESVPGAWWIGVGISLSFMGGVVKRAPRWMQLTGLEWVHRLTQEPRRLARRYLIDDLPFAACLLWNAWRSRHR